MRTLEEHTKQMMAFCYVIKDGVAWPTPLTFNKLRAFLAEQIRIAVQEAVDICAVMAEGGAREKEIRDNFKKAGY